MPDITRTTPFEQLPDLLRVEEFAAWADCSCGVVYEAIKVNTLPCLRVGRLVRVPKEALRAWLHIPERQAS